MNTILIVVSLVGIIIYGFYLMSRLDRFWENGGFSDVQPDYILKSVLILVDAEQMPLTKAVLKSKYECVHEPVVPQNTVFKSIYALSQNDMNNILLCAQAQKVDHPFTVALCNNKQYLSVFQDYRIDKVVFSLAEAYTLFDSTVYSERAEK